ncbi:hypothetical protein NQZ68_017310 [Dissostichus eleginoides]|nr:hypothetical protein NQZ68_017310 [Dissostichus eleginoides]
MSSDFYSRDELVERGFIPLDIDNVQILLQARVIPSWPAESCVTGYTVEGGNRAKVSTSYATADRARRHTLEAISEEQHEQ